MVVYTKANHKGWKNRTYWAQNHIVVIQKAKKVGKAIIGKWGSVKTFYMIFLEFKYGAALRTSLMRNKHRLAHHMIKAFKKAQARSAL